MKDSRIHCILTDDDLIDKLDIQLQKLCVTRRVPLMSIPARPNEDFDLLLGELLVRFMKKDEEIERLKGEVESLKCCGNCEHVRTMSQYPDKLHHATYCLPCIDNSNWQPII